VGLRCSARSCSGEGLVASIALVECPDLLREGLELRVGDLVTVDELECDLAELVVCLAELALDLDVFDALLRLRSGLLCCLFCLVEESHLEFYYSPRMPPRIPQPAAS
jgi:hypothetical protein